MSFAVFPASGTVISLRLLILKLFKDYWGWSGCKWDSTSIALDKTLDAAEGTAETILVTGASAAATGSCFGAVGFSSGWLRGNNCCSRSRASKYVFYEGRSINKLQNGAIPFILKIGKIRNIRFVGNLILKMHRNFCMMTSLL